MLSERFLRCLLALSVVACATPSQPSPPSDQTTGVLARPGLEFQLAVGETARIDGTSSRLTLRAVQDDSRCPADVQCVWAGSAKIVLTLLADGKPDAALAINTGVEPRSVQVPGYVLRVTGLSPEPRSGTTIPGSAYVVRFALAAI